jgi:hypothetical protein
MMHKYFYIPLLLAASVLFSSCEKDDVPQTDYSIKSTPDFELLSKHQNGWIKKARYQRAGVPTKEFEYYENGYIKSSKVYARYPQHHLYMEVSRSEDNKPLWSKYYNTKGELSFETKYANGLPLVKKVYSEEGTAIHNYTDGQLSSVQFTAADNSSTCTTTYNAAARSRYVSITNNGQTILEQEYPYQEQVGAGFYSNTDIPVANPFDALKTKYNDGGKSLLSSNSWEEDADPLELILPYRLPDSFRDEGRGFTTKFAISTDLYQTIIEQYPVTEKGILLAGGYKITGYDYFDPSFNVRDSLDKVHAENPTQFELKYGKEIVEKVNYGKTFVVVGALRNLPTDEKAANKVKEIALKRLYELRDNTITIMKGDKISFIQGEKISLTAEEREILNKVWFEVKFFSNLKQHRNGLVLNSTEEYKSAIEAVNAAEPSVIQLAYRAVNHF